MFINHEKIYDIYNIQYLGKVGKLIENMYEVNLNKICLKAFISWLTRKYLV